VFTADELAGEALFHGAGRCAGCHSTRAHVGQQVANIGLDATVIDEGAGEGRFKTPSLRNVAVRGRFMHDGRFATLQEVVEFYNSGVQDNPALDQSLDNPLQLNLTPQQVLQLVAYMETLTDNAFLTSDLFSDPFVTLPGDYDGNGVVEVEDYSIWSLGSGGAGSLAADGNGDEVVDAADYVVWRKFLGQTWQTLGGGGGLGSLAKGLPEPSATVLAVMAVVGRFGVRPKRRSRRSTSHD
jgi:hypothetical protein